MSKEKPKNPVEKPIKGSLTRVLRGGAWGNFSPFSLGAASHRSLEADYRFKIRPSYRIYYGNGFGFRITRTKK